METVQTDLPSENAEIVVLRWSNQQRFKYFVTGVVGPAACFIATICGLNVRITSLWQSGELEVYLWLLLEPKALLPFIPILIYSMIGLGACCVKVEWAKQPWVRTGVYCGSFLSSQYLFFVVFTSSIFPLICAAVVGVSLALLTYFAALMAPRAMRITIFQIMLLTTAVAVCASAGIGMGISMFNGWERVLENGIATLYFILAGVPFLNCLTYCRASIALLRSPALRPVSLRREWQFVGVFFAWLIAYGVSWKFALDAMLAEYEKLPTSPPKCYVTAAAACGHRGFVGVTKFSATDENRGCNAFPVNLQMCRLKFLEFVLAATSPAMHQWIRSVYDTAGPWAASVSRSSVWLADASYLALKPLEWLAFFCQVLAGVPSDRVRKLYSRR